MGSSKPNPVRLAVKNAIECGLALEAREIRAMRAENRKAIMLLKGTFWVGILVFNLALWVPLPFAVNQTLLYVIAAAALLIAVLVPILGLKQPQLNLELLQVTDRALKKKTASETGRVYIDQVKKQDRPFVNAEFEALDGGKWVQDSDA